MDFGLWTWTSNNGLQPKDFGLQTLDNRFRIRSEDWTMYLENMKPEIHILQSKTQRMYCETVGLLLRTP